MEAVLAQSMGFSTSDSLFKRLWNWLKRHKDAIGAAALTAFLLDIVTGLIFGFGGAALFAVV
jgi:hypothetical protein